METAGTELRRTDRNRGEYRRLRAYTWLWAIFIAAAALALVFTAWLFGVQVRDGGMAPALEQGDVLLFDRLSKFVRAPQRGDVVAFCDSAGEGLYLGRIVALPGERASIKGGRVYIDGVLLDERAYALGACEDMERVLLEQGEFLILPDDRADAVISASRLTVNASRIRGRALVRVYPWARIALF